MSIFNEYPYTSLHELNLDWLLSKMKELDAKVDDLIEEAIEQATENAKEYVDQELQGVLSEFASLQNAFNSLDADFNALSAQFVTLSTTVNNKINQLSDKIDADIIAVNNRTDQMIIDAINNLYNNLSTELANIKVINYFTGNLVSVQDMFNYLAMLHLTDSIDYDTMASRAKTYTYLAGLNISYTNLAQHGNSLYL